MSKTITKCMSKRFDRFWAVILIGRSLWCKSIILDKSHNSIKKIKHNCIKNNLHK